MITFYKVLKNIKVMKQVGCSKVPPKTKYNHIAKYKSVSCHLMGQKYKVAIKLNSNKINNIRTICQKSQTKTTIIQS